MTTIIQPLTQLGTWDIENPGAARAEAPIALAGVSTIFDAVAPAPGEIQFLSVTLNEVMTAGNLSVRASIGGILLTTQHVVTAANGLSALFRVLDANRLFRETARLGVELETDAGFLPITVDVAVQLWGVLNPGVSTDSDSA